MSVRFLRVESEKDVAEIARLTGETIESNETGWVAFTTEPQQVLGVGSLAKLETSAHEGVRSGARRIAQAPTPMRVRDRVFDWSRPVVMGIVNVTPDSFSDGGHFLDPASGVAHGLRLEAEGADILDVGGESTRPRGATYGAGAATVSVDDEISRVVPVIRGIRERSTIPISVDTRKAVVARAALVAGADIVNDVTGLMHDASIADVVAEAGAALMLMHTPRDIEELHHEQPSNDILGDVQRGLEAAVMRAGAVSKERIVLDPGIGFGKSVGHNLYLLKKLDSLRALGFPLLVGASRKASIAKAAAGGGPVAPPAERVPGSIAAAVLSYVHGAQILRVHDVRATVEALRVAAVIQSATSLG